MCLTGKRELCPACMKLFASTEAGDKHRTGHHGVTSGPTRRRCLSTEEMLSLTTKAGIPWFVVRQDRRGCEIWARNRPGLPPNPAWELGGDEAEHGTEDGA